MNADGVKLACSRLKLVNSYSKLEQRIVAEVLIFWGYRIEKEMWKLKPMYVYYHVHGVMIKLAQGSFGDKFPPFQR